MGLDLDFSKLDARDVLDLAIFAEKEAQEHYEQVATWMVGRGNAEAGEFFNAMAVREQRHAESIARRRAELFGDAPCRHTDVGGWDVETPDYDQIDLDMPVIAALKVSLASEVNAHDYYAQALEYVSDPQVEGLLEELRLSEIEHQKMIERQIARLEKD